MEDHGDADPAVAAALTGYAATGSPAGALAALSASRVLIPVVPVAAGSGATEMATVLSTGRDGRTALLAFTSVPALRRWRQDARPVPRPTGEAAAAALGQGAAALLIDLCGPVPLVITGQDLEHLAAGLLLVETSAGHAWARPDLRTR